MLSGVDGPGGPGWSVDGGRWLLVGVLIVVGWWMGLVDGGRWMVVGRSVDGVQSVGAWWSFGRWMVDSGR